MVSSWVYGTLALILPAMTYITHIADYWTTTLAYSGIPNRAFCASKLVGFTLISPCMF